jgi:hypothetical protein
MKIMSSCQHYLVFGWRFTLTMSLPTLSSHTSSAHLRSRTGREEERRRRGEGEEKERRRRGEGEEGKGKGERKGERKEERKGKRKGERKGERK